MSTLKTGVVCLVLAGACLPMFAASASQALGPGDQITIQALHVPDIVSAPIRIDADGFINLPIAGRIKAGGLSVDELQHAVAGRLNEFIVAPEVSINVAEYHSQPVSVVGSVNTPGVYQLQGHKTLAEILAMAGGPKPDAADRARITRRESCTTQVLPGARPNQERDNTVTGEVSLSEMFVARNDAASLDVCPGDVIAVPRAHLIYVMGEVHKPGGFPLRDQENASVIQALSMSEGLLRTASKRAMILRVRPGGGEREQIPVDIKGILEGKTRDETLFADDVLLVPNNLAKNAMARAAETLIQIGTGVVIWGRY